MALRESFTLETASTTLITVACQCVGHAFSKNLVPTSQKRLINSLVTVLRREVGGNEDGDDGSATLSSAHSADPAAPVSVRAHAVLSLLAKLWISAEDAILENIQPDPASASAQVLSCLHTHAALLQRLWSRIALDRVVASGLPLSAEQKKQRDRYLPILTTWPDSSTNGTHKFEELYNERTVWPRLAAALAATFGECPPQDNSTEDASEEKLPDSSNSLSLLVCVFTTILIKGIGRERGATQSPTGSSATPTQTSNVPPASLALALRGLAHLLRLHCNDAEGALEFASGTTLLDIAFLIQRIASALTADASAPIMLGIASVLKAFAGRQRQIASELLIVVCDVGKQLLTYAIQRAETTDNGDEAPSKIGAGRVVELVLKAYCDVVISGCGLVHVQEDTEDHTRQRMLQRLLDLVRDDRVISAPNLSLQLSQSLSKYIESVEKSSTASSEQATAVAMSIIAFLLSRLQEVPAENKQAAQFLWSTFLKLVILCCQSEVLEFQLSSKIALLCGKAYAKVAMADIGATTTLRRVLQHLMKQSRQVAKDALQSLCASTGPTTALILATPNAALEERLASVQVLLLTYRVTTDAANAPAQQQMLGLLLVVFVRAAQAGDGSASFRKLEATIHTAVLGLLQIARESFKHQVAALNPTDRSALQALMQQAMQSQQKQSARTVASAPKLSLASGF